MGDRRASFVDETLIYTNKHLSQFAGADLNPYAIHFARLMLEDYKLSIQAQRIYNRALNNLPAYSTPDDNLQFGWSSYSLIKMGVIHSLSYEHRMLCSAMTECFSEEYTAAVLAALGKECEALVETSPHVSQFRAVAHHCNGILCKSSTFFMSKPQLLPVFFASEARPSLLSKLHRVSPNLVSLAAHTF